MKIYPQKTIFILSIFLSIISSNSTFSINDDSLFFAQNYDKQEITIKMRDGINLFTAIYLPKNKTEKQPIIIWRSPYSCQPYGKQNYFTRSLNTFLHFIKNNYIIVIQDVRGRFMSEGNFVDMRPHIPNKMNNSQVDESSDAYDTIEWLVKNVENNNGNVGVWGISYPGFYAAMAAIDAHPNLKAVSPQAPIADWFIADDMHHYGALSLTMTFNFFNQFGVTRNELTKIWPDGVNFNSPDAYNFYLKLGSLKNINKLYFKNNIAFWDSVISHPNYDFYWQEKNTLPHFNNIKPAILTVGGWFDGEDLYGAINTYQSIERKNSKIDNNLVLGPWPHGGWTRTDGNKFGDINLNSNTSKFYVDSIELPFFNYYLKNEGKLNLAEAYIFETGKNIWNKFDQYPPQNIAEINLYLNSENAITFSYPQNSKIIFDEYISDPNKPVPYTSKFIDAKDYYYKEYLNEDQRFASTRQDVLVYETEILQNDFSIVGPIETELFVSTSGTDSDWIVKVIDVFPDSTKDIKIGDTEIEMGGYQMLVRGEILRGKYRNSLEFPEPFSPNEITKVKIYLNDACHTFKKGHKIMIQIQSSWFPLFDRNPQKFIDIYNADESDFQKATQRIYFSKNYPSKIKLNKLITEN
ncbi:MAG: CocE/NonD family hydrolase [Ignavibacteriae bacterium]|nr:CocE/NonD family hydrolase [Ignavibacteriota bacterium]